MLFSPRRLIVLIYILHKIQSIKEDMILHHLKMHNLLIYIHAG